MTMFLTIHTNYGLQALASAESTGTQISLTHMAVGDGNGNPVTPNPLQTQLVRERFRATINRVFQSPTDPLRFTAELVIPASVGGFTLREVGVFDADGSLFAVGNLPDTYKPVDTEGSYSDTVVRLDFMVSNASTITLQVDPNVVVVTQQWISNNVTAGTLIPGGTTGQVLAKQSNADGDVIWIDPTEANVVVDIVEDRQTLAAGQTVIDLVETITYGLAVYIEGVRINRGPADDEWQPDPNIETRLILGQSYPQGTAFLGVNNEPAGSSPAPLERSKNLSDVADKAQSRANLDVFSKGETRQLAPAGLVATFARTTAPTGWMKANGAAVSRTTYADLFAAIGTTFGAGDGINTFNLPDLRGEFMRYWDDGRGIDAGRSIGSYQKGSLIAFDDAARNAVMSVWAGGGGTDTERQSAGLDPTYELGPCAVNFTTSNIQYSSSGSSVNATGTARPRNVALLACIKF